MLKYVSLCLIFALALTLMALASLDGSIPLAPVEAQDATLQALTVRIDPAQSVVDVGETFTVTVMIDQASDLGAFQFDLLYITTTVTADGVVMGDFLGSTGRTVSPVGPIIDNQAGRVSFGAWTVGSAPGPNGTGTLVIITLTAQDVGISRLDLQEVKVLDTHAGDQPPIVEDGMVVAGGAPRTGDEDPEGETTPAQKKGLAHAGLAVLAVSFVWLFMTVDLVSLVTLGSVSLYGGNAPLYAGDPELSVAQNLVPFFSSLVAGFMILFIFAGIAYGRAAGTIKDHRDIVDMMAGAMKDMGYYLVVQPVAAGPDFGGERCQCDSGVRPAAAHRAGSDRGVCCGAEPVRRFGQRQMGADGAGAGAHADAAQCQPGNGYGGLSRG